MSDPLSFLREDVGSETATEDTVLLLEEGIDEACLSAFHSITGAGESAAVCVMDDSPRILPADGRLSVPVQIAYAADDADAVSPVKMAGDVKKTVSMKIKKPSKKMKKRSKKTAAEQVIEAPCNSRVFFRDNVKTGNPSGGRGGGVKRSLYGQKRKDQMLKAVETYFDENTGVKVSKFELQMCTYENLAHLKLTKGVFLECKINLYEGDFEKPRVCF